MSRSTQSRWALPPPTQPAPSPMPGGSWDTSPRASPAMLLAPQSRLYKDETKDGYSLPCRLCSCRWCQLSPGQPPPLREQHSFTGGLRCPRLLAAPPQPRCPAPHSLLQCTRDTPVRVCRWLSTQHPPPSAERAMQNPMLKLPHAAPLPSIGSSLPAQLPSGSSPLEDRFSFCSACSRVLDTLIGSSRLGSSELGNSNSKGQVVFFFAFQVSLPLLRKQQGRTHAEKMA